LRIGVDWSDVERNCFNDRINPDDEDLGAQIVRVLINIFASLLEKNVFVLIMFLKCVLRVVVFTIDSLVQGSKSNLQFLLIISYKLNFTRLLGVSHYKLLFANSYTVYCLLLNII
jgi:hypothetical protein